MNDDSTTCQACGYDLSVHTLPGDTPWPDANGGCPRHEVEAMQRAGWL